MDAIVNFAWFENIQIRPVTQQSIVEKLAKGDMIEVPADGNESYLDIDLYSETLDFEIPMQGPLSTQAGIVDAYIAIMYRSITSLEFEVFSGALPTPAGTETESEGTSEEMGGSVASSGGSEADISVNGNEISDHADDEEDD